MAHKADLDPVDREVLRLLPTDGRSSYQALADEVGLSRPAVMERVKRLEEAGVPSLFESLHALHHRGSRQSNFIGEGLVTRSPVGRKEPQNLAVDGVQIGLVRHFGAPVPWLPTRSRRL